MNPSLFIIVSFSTYHTMPGNSKFSSNADSIDAIFFLVIDEAQISSTISEVRWNITRILPLTMGQSFIHSFIHHSPHSFNKYLLSVSSMTCSSQHVKDKTLKQWTRQKHLLTSGSLESLSEKTDIELMIMNITKEKFRELYM